MTMDGLTKKINNIPASKISSVSASQPTRQTDAPGFQGNFQKALEGALHRQQPVQFSKHAHMRLSDRQITLTGEQLSRVEDGLTKANAKGIRDSLVLVDDVALVVNVKSKTVITAMGSGQDNVFSNIDGAVIV